MLTRVGTDDMSKTIFVLLSAALLEAASVDRLSGLVKKRQETACDDPGNFLCPNGENCVEPQMLCDSFDDCGDNSDEELPQCPPPGSCTGPNRFACRNGKCVPINLHCDLMDDCGDGTDEQYCDPSSCTDEVVKCDNGLCILPSWLCDGDDDCGNGWDENPENCRTTSQSATT